MNDFTKEELELISLEFTHGVLRYGRESCSEEYLELLEKVDSMIENYCEHEKCPNCDLSPHPANVDCIKLEMVE